MNILQNVVATFINHLAAYYKSSLTTLKELFWGEQTAVFSESAIHTVHYLLTTKEHEEHSVHHSDI